MSETHLALHGLALKKHATAAAAAAAVGLPAQCTEALLEQAVAGGRATKAAQGYALTPAGRMILDAQYGRHYGELRADRGFVAAYERFERVNAELKQLVTDWQTRRIGGERVANDHADAAYDAGIIARLGDLHERFEPVARILAAGLARLAHHFEALEQALERAERGEREWVSDARIASYHTVWFELHEDLLRILGRQRAE